MKTPRSVLGLAAATAACLLVPLFACDDGPSGGAVSTLCKNDTECSAGLGCMTDTKASGYCAPLCAQDEACPPRISCPAYAPTQERKCREIGQHGGPDAGPLGVCDLYEGDHGPFDCRPPSEAPQLQCGGTCPSVAGTWKLTAASCENDEIGRTVTFVQSGCCFRQSGEDHDEASIDSAGRILIPSDLCSGTLTGNSITMSCTEPGKPTCTATVTRQ